MIDNPNEERFMWVDEDTVGCNLRNPEEVSALDLGHALQKIAPRLHSKAVYVHVWNLSYR